MGYDIEGGVDFDDGELVTAARLDAHVQNATIKPTLISQKSIKTDLTRNENVLIEDGGVLKRTNVQQILDSLDTSKLMPVGSISEYAGATAPTGWLLCYGQEVDRDTYDKLFEAIGTLYGDGNGTTTFNIPDLRGRVVAGVGNMGGVESSRLDDRVDSAIGEVGGQQSITLVTGNLPSHSHTGACPDHLHYMQNHTHGLPMTNSDAYSSPVYGLLHGGWRVFVPLLHTTMNYGSSGPSTPYTAGADRSLAFTTSSVGSGTATSNVQPTIELNKIIKV